MNLILLCWSGFPFYLKFTYFHQQNKPENQNFVLWYKIVLNLWFIMNLHDMSPRDKIYFSYMKVYSIWWEQLHKRKIIFAPRWHIIKVHSELSIIGELSILGQFLTKGQILIFRVAIFMKISKFQIEWEPWSKK